MYFFVVKIPQFGYRIHEKNANIGLFCRHKKSKCRLSSFFVVYTDSEASIVYKYMFFQFRSKWNTKANTTTSLILVYL